MDNEEQVASRQQERDSGFQTNASVWRFGVRRSFRDRSLWWSSVIGLSAGLLLAAGLTLFFHATRVSVVLHYTTLLGIDRLGDWIELLIYPGVLVALILVNFSIASSIRSPTPFINGLISVTNLLLTATVSFGSTLLFLVNRSALP